TCRKFGGAPTTWTCSSITPASRRSAWKWGSQRLLPALYRPLRQGTPFSRSREMRSLVLVAMLAGCAQEAPPPPPAAPAAETKPAEPAPAVPAAATEKPADEVLVPSPPQAQNALADAGSSAQLDYLHTKNPAPRRPESEHELAARLGDDRPDVG